MSFSVSLAQRALQLKKALGAIDTVLMEAQEEATKRAVEAAADATPPKAGTGRGPYMGTNTVTGQLKARWAMDSKTKPEYTHFGGARIYRTFLRNDMEYASYVNDGHRLDRHFVPGLYVNPDSGLLEYDPAADVGLIVGTKTRYVKGEFMVDKGIEAYERAILAHLDGEIGRLTK